MAKTFKAGDSVMYVGPAVKDGPMRGLTLGYVKSVTPTTVDVQLRDGKVLTSPPSDWDVVGEEIGSRSAVRSAAMLAGLAAGLGLLWWFYGKKR